MKNVGIAFAALVASFVVILATGSSARAGDAPDMAVSDHDAGHVASMDGHDGGHRASANGHDAGHPSNGHDAGH